MATLKTVFKEVFGEALEPLGFVKIKGRHPYFVRLIGDEILHVVTYTTRPTRDEGYKEFAVYGGVATVYRQHINLDISPCNNTNWFKSNLGFYKKETPLISDRKYSFDDLYTFSYNEETLIESVKHSLRMTEEIMLPILSEVTDLDLCLKHLRKYGGGWLIIYDDDEDFGDNNVHNPYIEGLLYVKTNYRGDFMENVMNQEEYETIDAQLVKHGKRGHQYKYDKYYERAQKGALHERARLDKILDNPDKYTKVIAELERRKTENIERLKSYGLKI